MIEKERTGEKSSLKHSLFLLGDSGVGKSYFFKKIQGAKIDKTIVSTLGVDKRTIYYKKFNDEDEDKDLKDAQMQLVDSSGNNKYLQVVKEYIKKSDAAIVFYDITNTQSFESVGHWIDAMKEETKDKNGYTFFLIGNKKDLVEENQNSRQVSEEEAKKICKEKNLEWIGEISAKNFTQEQLLKIFWGIFKKIRNNMPIEKKTEPSENKKKKGCCPCLG